jgi:hypothetical protein
LKRRQWQATRTGTLGYTLDMSGRIKENSNNTMLDLHGMERQPSTSDHSKFAPSK